MKHSSIVQQRGQVPFPTFTGERAYMREFTQRDGLPADLIRWQPTVDAMLQGIITEQPIYIMIDQGDVVAGASQRRPGMHIDGYWCAGIQAHGGGGSHITGSWDTKPNWSHTNFSKPEALILASDVSACRALVGEYTGEIGDGGDCSHMDLTALASVRLASGYAYAGNVTMLHESLPVSVNTRRTLVRLNVPGWTPSVH